MGSLLSYDVDFEWGRYTKRVTVAAAYTPISPKLSKQSGPALSGGVAGVETFYLIELVTESGATYPLSKDTHDGACVPGRVLLSSTSGLNVSLFCA